MVRFRKYRLYQVIFFVLTSPFLLTGTLIRYANLYLSIDPLFTAQF